MPTQTTLAREALRGAGSTFRPATLDDLPWVVAFVTARDPSEPANEEQMRHWWRFNDPERIDDRWIIEEDGGPVGYASFGHPAWEKSPLRAARFQAWFARDPEPIGVHPRGAHPLHEALEALARVRHGRRDVLDRLLAHRVQLPPFLWIGDSVDRADLDVLVAHPPA